MNTPGLPTFPASARADAAPGRFTCLPPEAGQHLWPGEAGSTVFLAFALSLTCLN